MLVLVLITNCQVSLNANSGPETAQTIIRTTAMINVSGLPAAAEVAFENMVKSDVFFVVTIL